MSRAVLTRAAIFAATLLIVGGCASAQVAVANVSSTTRISTESASNGPKYVALGSSYAAGPGGATRVGDPRCMRTIDNYPHQVADALGFSLTDATCSGSTTSEILEVSQWRHADHPQIDAVTADTRLVTITTGGNDIDYIGRVVGQSCANLSADSIQELGIHGCRRGRRVAPEPSLSDYAQVELAMVEVVRAVRSRAPHAEIVLVDYAPLLDPDGNVCPKVPLTAAEGEETVRIFNSLTAATARAAMESGAELVPASKAAIGHDACSDSPWIRGFELPVPYHPTAAGKTGVADLVIAALRHTGATSESN